MTDYEAPRHEDLTGWLLDDPAWDDYRPAERPAAPKPWYRSSGLLLAAIGMAAAALVVATALLVAGNFSGVIPAKARLGTRATSAEPRPTAPTVQSGPTGSATSAPTTTPDTTAASSGASSEASPPSPAHSAAPPTVTPRLPGGPEVELTRTPMSFAPTIHPK